MSGLIRRLFAPRWRHPDPEVRRQATLRLDPERDDQRQALERLAVDEDSSVRHAALERLDDPDRLLTLRAEQGESAELRERLVMLLIGRAGHHDLGHRIALAETLDDPAMLERLAWKATTSNCALPPWHGSTPNPPDSASLRERHRGGSSCRRRTGHQRGRPDAPGQRGSAGSPRDTSRSRTPQPIAHRCGLPGGGRERRRDLLEKLEAHANSAWEPLYAGRFRHLVREWTQLEDTPEADQERRYQDACLRCRKVISDHEAHEHAQDAADRQREDADQARESLVEALEESLDGLRHGERLADQDLASLKSQKQLMASRWQALSDKHLADDALRQRYDAALASYDRIVQARVRLDERADALQQALKDGDDERLAALVDACGWPDELPPSPLLKRARDQLARQQQAPADDDLEARLARFSDDLAQLEQLLESGTFKGASRLHQRLRQQADELPRQRIDTARLKRLGARLAELRDWRGFVAGPKRDQLCKDITHSPTTTRSVMPNSTVTIAD